MEGPVLNLHGNESSINLGFYDPKQSIEFIEEMSGAVIQ